MILISKVFGNYARQFMTSVIPFMSFILSAFIFSIPLKKRSKLPVRLLIGFIFYLIIFTGIAVIRTDFDSAFLRCAVRISLYFLILPYLFTFLREAPLRVLLCWCGCIAGQEFSSKLFSLLLILLGRNDLETNSLLTSVSIEANLLIQLAFTGICCFILS